MYKHIKALLFFVVLGTLTACGGGKSANEPGIVNRWKERSVVGRQNNMLKEFEIYRPDGLCDFIVHNKCHYSVGFIKGGDSPLRACLVSGLCRIFEEFFRHAWKLRRA